MKTVALIIGNDNYKDNKLANAINDAASIRDVFARLRYTIIYKTDCKRDDFAPLLDSFDKAILEHDASIFYFAGHGFELNGENYLVPVDCEIPPQNQHYANHFCLRLSELLDIYKKYPNKVNIAILDACRKSFERGNTVSTAPVFAPRGTLLAFSTSPNEGANDNGSDGHSIYTGALLQYIGREQLTVEELFKNVRKTVYATSEGKQTPWEHTSLINDYYFNSLQLTPTITIPYSEEIVKDINYISNDDFGNLILELKSYNWKKQNLAINKLLAIPVKELDKNQLFILGRNLLQASGAAINAIKFMEAINTNIVKYSVNGENHLLNGILFEIYFNSYGEFRKEKTKKHFIEKILALRKIESLKSSFDFISKLLENNGYGLIYLPKDKDEYIDINIVASKLPSKNEIGEEIVEDVISKISYKNVDITKQIRNYYNKRYNEKELKQVLAHFFTAPKELIQLHCNIKLDNIAFTDSSFEDLDL